jgi:hypothetical protein
MSYFSTPLKGLQAAANRAMNALAALVQRLAAPNTLPTAEPIQLDFTVNVLRPDDLFVATLGFANLRLIKGNLTALPRLVALREAPSYIVLYLPTQSMGEQDAKRLAKPSVLVYQLRLESLPLEYTLARLLEACGQAHLVVSAGLAAPLGHAARRDRIHLEVEEGIFTAIEAPYRLVLSPAAEAAFTEIALPQPDRATGRTPIWHMHLAHMAARAVWSPDLAAPQGEAGKQRAVIARQTADQRSVPPGVENPTLSVEVLTLSALGATFDLTFAPSNAARLGLSPAGWAAHGAQGRTTAQIGGERGYLLPFGHAAVLVEGTQRRFTDQGAALVEGRYIAVQQPELTFNRRDLPFKTIRIVTPYTPDFADPRDYETARLADQGERAFWIKLPAEGDLTDYHFQLEAVDHADRTIRFSAPLVFVAEALTDPSSGALTGIKRVIEAYNNAAQPLALHAQPLAFAPSRTEGDTTLYAHTLTLGAAFALEAPYFQPTLLSASVTLPALSAFGVADSEPQRLVWEESYTTQPDPDQFGNSGEVFARLATPLSIRFAPSQLGGIAMLAIAVEGISRRYGAVGNLKNVRDGLFLPTQLLENATILGNVPIRTLISTIAADQALNAAAIPVLAANTHGARYRWHVERTHLRETGFFMPAEKGSFHLALDHGDAYRVRAALEDFRLLTPDNLLALAFKRVAAAERGGVAYRADIHLEHAQLRGALMLLQPALSALIPDGFSRFGKQTYTTDHLEIDYTQALPSLLLGFSHTHALPMHTVVRLPMDDAPLSLSVTVGAPTGGTYSRAEMDTDGVRSAEAVATFSAPMTFELGEALATSGAYGGTSLSYQRGAPATFFGVVRGYGMLSALGIMRLSTTFTLPMGYYAAASKPLGAATLRLNPTLAFFERGVRLPLHRALSSAYPNDEDWSAYAAAFADDDATTEA